MKNGKNTKIKYVIDYRDELVEKFPYIHEREMTKILKNMSTVLLSYLGKGMRGLTVFPHEYKDNKEKYINKIVIAKARTKKSKARMGYLYKTILLTRLRLAREAKVNAVKLDVKKEAILKSEKQKKK